MDSIGVISSWMRLQSFLCIDDDTASPVVSFLWCNHLQVESSNTHLGIFYYRFIYLFDYVGVDFVTFVSH